MPYITQDRRRDIDGGTPPSNAGELNYAITRMVDAYIQANGGIRYARINEVIGVLECAKLEAYRRIAGPYEDIKISESGDVYESLDDL